MSGSFEDEAETSISIDEYIESIEAKELEADLVLGGDEGDECTYAKGYMKRQAIFSCMTCTPEGNAGVCTACCLSCHDGHELLELWTKRNFRCDCGNSKFGAFACKLSPSKDAENVENSYNHNFKGLYCSCNRPYPDPDAEEQEEMIQCCICEDWFHEEHLDLKPSDEIVSLIPKDEEGEPIYEDFICKSCSPVCSFLMLYPEKLWAAKREHVASANACSDKSEPKEIHSECGSAEVEKDVSSLSSPSKYKGVVDADVEPVKSLVGESSEKITCVLGVGRPTIFSNFDAKPLFLSKNWREILCRCDKCLEVYKQKNISYLLDKEDTIAEYEKRAQQKRTEKLQQQEGESLSFFNNLNHVAKVEILNGIKDFTEEFRVLLESADPSKTITAADVQQMFDNLKNKRRRME